MRLASLALTILAPPLLAQQSLAGPRLFPRGAWSVGVYSTRFDVPTQSYLFTLRDLGGQKLVEYALSLAHPNVARGLLRIEETTTGVVPIAGGGLFYRTQNPPAFGLGRLITPLELAFGPQHDPLHDATLLSHSVDATGAVTLRFRDEYDPGTGRVRTEKMYRLRLHGKSLEVGAFGDATVRRIAAFNYAGLHLGGGDGLRTPAQALHIPYMDMVPVFADADGVFVSRFLDWYLSNGSDTPSTVPSIVGSSFAGETSSGVYRNDRNELNAPVAETAWITVSRDIEDTFPVVDRPPSEYRILCAERAVSQNAPGNRYDKARDWVVRAAALGLDDMLHIKWDWTKWPFNLNDPDWFLPPPTAPVGTIWGTVREWSAFAQSVADANWSLVPYFALDIMDPGYPNLTLNLPGSLPGSVLLTPNPAWDATQIVRDGDGQPKKGWDTTANLAGTNLQGQGHPTDVRGPHLFASALTGAGQRIHGVNGFPVGGLHIDAQTEIPAWNQIDQRAGSAFSHTIAELLRDREAEFRAGKDALDGPLFGENSHWRYRAFETFAAGLLDGTSRKIPVHWNPATGPPSATNWDEPVIPDFELLEVAPKATASFGMGWESHYRGTSFPIPESFMDGWHTTLLSFGHAPYFGTNGDVPNNYWDWRGTVRSVYLTLGLSAAMRRSRVVAIRYEDQGGVERSLGEAVAHGLDLRHPRLVLRFADGLEFKANHSPGVWSTTVLGRAVDIPTDGFAALSPSGLVAVSVVNPQGGARVDYALVPGHYEMIDRRGFDQSYRGFPGVLLPVPPGLFPGPRDDRQMVVVRNLRHATAIYATGFESAVQPLGPTPALTGLAIEVDDTDTLSIGRLRLGVRAVATDQNGNRRDVTGRALWTSAQPGVATVNRQGGLAAIGLGQTRITASLPGTSLTASRDVLTNANPVLSPLRIEALTGTAAIATMTTDSRSPISLVVVTTVSSGSQRFVLGRIDPGGKHHQFLLVGLTPATAYRIEAAAANEFGLAARGPVLAFTTP